MSTVHIVDVAPAALRLATLVSRSAPGDLGRPTPCPAYQVGDLIDHIGGLAVVFAGVARKDAASGDQAPPGDATRLAADWAERIPRDLAELARAWQDPAAWAGMTRVGGGDAPGEVAGLVLCDELVVHGWDLARATGQPYDAEPDVCDAALRFLGMFASPEAPAGPDVAFGPARVLPGTAPPLDRAISLAGRDLDWSAP
jgi:uncharacterized protein (TIGR03086 family)